jgi:hypothetical protein
MIAYAHKSSMLPSCSIAVRLFVRSVGMSYTPCVTKRCAASGCERRSHVAKLVAKAEPHGASADDHRQRQEQTGSEPFAVASDHHLEQESENRGGADGLSGQLSVCPGL